MTLLDHFDRAFVINLEERTDRREELERELARAGMPLGAEGVELYTAVKPASAAGFRSAASRGCVLSHLAVLERALDGAAGSVLVMEDDVALSPRLAPETPALVAQLRSRPWGMLYVGHPVPVEDAGPVRLVPHSGPVLLTHCYAVHASMLRPLVEFLRALLTRPPGHPDGGPMDIDGAFSTFRDRHPEFVTLLAVPSLASQRSSRSDLAPRWFDTFPALRSLAQAARVARRALRPPR